MSQPITKLLIPHLASELLYSIFAYSCVACIFSRNIHIAEYWKSNHEALRLLRLFTMTSSAPWSFTSVSVTYGTSDVGLHLQEGRDIKYAPLDQASKLVASMPYTARNTLSAPIRAGLIDPQSAYYWIDDKQEGKIAICVEDFAYLCSCFPNEEAEVMKQADEDVSIAGSAEDDSAVPPRLLDALHLLSDEPYSTIAEDGSSGYSSQTNGEPRSRGYSAISEQSGDSLPAIPYSRPPPSHDCRNRSISSTSVGQRILKNEQTSHLHISEESLQLGDSEQSKQEQEQLLLQSQPHEEVKQRVQNEDLRFQKGGSYWRKLLALVLVAFIILGVITLLIYFSVLRKKGPEITVPIPPPVHKYDCVNGSISMVEINQDVVPLVDLNIPEMQPTQTIGNLEYLCVSSAVERKYAQMICTAWCGYLVPINGPERNEMILELVRTNMPKFSFYWIGLRGWRGSWYMDDESNVTFFNFPDQEAADRSTVNSADDSVEIDNANVQVDTNGVWSTTYGARLRPFVCVRNTVSKNIQRTPFHPHQEKLCERKGGRCRYDTDCTGGKTERNLCKDQAFNILCCVPNVPSPTPEYNSSIKTCNDAGGICNHVAEDECRDGKVIFDLKVPCPDRPRRLDCCVQNEIAF